MFANTRLHVMPQHHDVIPTLIAIQWNSLCANCRFLKRGPVDHIGVLQTPIIVFYGTVHIVTPNLKSYVAFAVVFGFD